MNDSIKKRAVLCFDFNITRKYSQLLGVAEKQIRKNKYYIAK